MEGSAPEVAIVGAGPYGLAAAAHLRAAGIEPLVLGETMEFWRQRMPSRMVLRSPWHASSIADPEGRFTLDRHEARRTKPLRDPIPIDEFIEYADWFQTEAVPGVDPRRVVRVDGTRDGFRLALDDEGEVEARRVVVAAGLGPFAWRPPEFDGLPESLASHSSRHRDFGGFAGRRVVVLGGGQSALESAALLNEAGAEVAVLARAPTLHWLAPPPMRGRRSLGHRLLYPPTDVGPPGLNWIVAIPALYRLLPRQPGSRTARRCIRPAGAHWLRTRLCGVPLATERTVASAEPNGGELQLWLDDGSERQIDHLLLATGFRVDISGYQFLSGELLRAIDMREGYPVLRRGLESSVPGLHFLGAPAALSFGPIMRFVSGTPYAARALTARVVGRAHAARVPRSAPRRPAPDAR